MKWQHHTKFTNANRGGKTFIIINFRFLCDENPSWWVRIAENNHFQQPELMARKRFESFTLFNSGALWIYVFDCLMDKTLYHYHAKGNNFISLKLYYSVAPTRDRGDTTRCPLFRHSKINRNDMITFLKRKILHFVLKPSSEWNSPKALGAFLVKVYQLEGKNMSGQLHDCTSKLSAFWKTWTTQWKLS